MRLLSAAQMRTAETEAISRGINELRLMENAGAAAAKAINDELSVSLKMVAVVCGSGNNGGDGYVVARKLKEYGAKVSIIRVFGLPQTKSSDHMCSKATEISLPVYDYADNVAKCNAVIGSSDIIVDAVFGLGFRGEADNLTASLFEVINKSGATVAAIDLPSGVYANGGISHNAVIADLTVTFECYKPCHIHPFSLDICGKVRVAPIGIPSDIMDQFSSAPINISFDECVAALPKRFESYHKGNCGTALIIAGSRGFAGAAIIAARAAIKSGVGILKVALPESVYPIVAGAVPEAVMIPLPENESGTISVDAIYSILKNIKNSDSVMVGPGLGCNEDTTAVMRELIINCDKPLIIDADGLNSISRCIDIIEQKKADVIITPHPKEFSRLCDLPVYEIESDRFLHAKNLAERFGITVVLKGRYTVVADGEGVCFNTTGNPGMATAGSGDMLAGIAASLIAQGMSAGMAARAAVSIHAAAGDMARDKYSMRAMTVTDMINQLPELFKNTELSKDLRQ